MPQHHGTSSGKKTKKIIANEASKLSAKTLCTNIDK